LLELYRYLFDTWHGACRGRNTGAVSISAPQRVSPEYFTALDALSAQHRVPLYAHLLETRTQRVLRQVHPRFGGRSLVQYVHELGLLNERTNVIHAVWVDDADLDLTAASGAVVVHNPVSNLRLGSGVMPFRAMRDRAIPIARSAWTRRSATTPATCGTYACSRRHLLIEWWASSVRSRLTQHSKVNSRPARTRSGIGLVVGIGGVGCVPCFARRDHY
jgi:hypothetical protein